ncbi:MAG: hypothetical protein FJ029_14625 [Actinobacteria bacterium]|nr:hypothetical protein [Actinomycetota bacterium]
MMIETPDGIGGGQGRTGASVAGDAVAFFWLALVALGLLAVAAAWGAA